MSDVVIQVENLSKQYRLGEVSTGSLHHDINRWWHRIRGKEDPYLSVTGVNIRTGKSEKNNSQNSNNSRLNDYVWALKDINFEVRRGEVLGIIGRNGAGKSTLLKIMSRITAPTTGEVRIKGRIASLLEVGTGFHQDLTGRENIYLNGAVLGMTRQEIAAKLDEIVEFSGCARYLDTPVKRYSSGMVVRLGFAVAAHLEPEILIVDEVLAVGDAEFQKKCIGKMQDVASHGRTVLFVSHNMAAVQRLCPACIVLDEGSLVLGPVASVDAVLEYLGQNKVIDKKRVHFDRDAFRLEDIRVVTIDGELVSGAINHDENYGIEIDFTLDRYDSEFRIGIELSDKDGNVLFMSMSTDGAGGQEPRITAGRNCLRVTLPAYFLNEGDYHIGVTAYYRGAFVILNPQRENIWLPFSVNLGPGCSPEWSRKRPGPFAPLLTWGRVNGEPQ